MMRPTCRIRRCLAAVVAISSTAATPAPLTVDELVELPHVVEYAAIRSGGAVWIEVRSGAANLFVARPPDWLAQRITSNAVDDGIALSIADVAGDGTRALLFRGGKPNAAGETPNPQNLVDPTVRELLLVSLTDGSVARIDGGPGSAIDSATFAPEGARIVYSKGGEVWIFDRRSGAPATRLFSTRGTVHALSWAPDGHRLALISDRSRYHRGNYAFIGVFDLERRTLTWMEPGLTVDSSPVWSPDGRRLAFIRTGVEPKSWRFSDERSGPPFSLIVADSESGVGNTVWTAPLGTGSRFSGFEASIRAVSGGTRDLHWLRDGKLAFPYEGNGWRLLYAVPADGGNAFAFASGRFEVDGASLDDNGTTLIIAANSEADPHRLHLYMIDAARGNRVAALTEGTGIEWDPVTASGDGSILYRQAGARSLERLMLRRRDGTVIQLSSGLRASPDFDTRTVAGEIVSFEALDGLTIPAILFRPAGAHAARSASAVIHAHGGSRSKVYPVWSSGFGPHMAIRYLVSRGYYVLSVNFRSGTGYGLEFREPASYGGRGAGDVQDFLAANRWLTTHVREVHPGRIAIFGHSYGGHIVSNTLARSDLYAAGIDSAGVGDWVVEMETDSRGELPFNIPSRQQIEAQAYASSAISQIEQWGDEPVLFLHGDDDGSAALQQSIELYLALQRRGKPVESVVFPGEAHALQLAANQKRYLLAIESFLARSLKRD